MMLFLREIYPNPESYKIIWNNKDILIEDNSVFWSTWKDRGIIYICDLLDIDNKFLSLQDLHLKYGIPLNMMKYNSILSAIVSAKRQNSMYRYITYDDYTDINFESKVFKSINQNYIPFESKHSKVFYQEFIESISNEPTALTYWQTHTEITKENFFLSLSLIRASCKESKLIEFHYKILNNYVNVNSNLYKWKLKDSAKCNSCEHEDSLLHNLLRCKYTREWINEMIEYLNSYAGIYVCFTEHEYIFGCKNPALNHIFLIMKYIIWSLKNFEKPFNLNVFRYNMYKRIKAEEMYKSEVKFNMKWNKFLILYMDLKESYE